MSAPTLSEAAADAPPFGRTMKVAHRLTQDLPDHIVTPRELIEGVAFEPSTAPGVAARRVLHLLIQAAGGAAWEDRVHRVTKGDLGQGRKGAAEVERLLDAVDRMRLALPSLSCRGHVAREYVGLFSLLRVEVAGGSDALVEYRFREEIRRLFAASNEYAILSRKALGAIEGRYSLTLYVLGALFVGRRHSTLTVSPAELVALLGMPTETPWAELERAALKKAQAELILWSSIAIQWTTQPARPRGRQSVRRVELIFTHKDDFAERLDAQPFCDLRRADRRAVAHLVASRIASATLEQADALGAAIAAELVEPTGGQKVLDDEICW